MPRVRVLLFAGLRERVGAGTIEVDVPESACIADVLAAAERLHPRLVGQRFATALNERYVERDAPVSGDDEVALIPPVSGG